MEFKDLDIDISYKSVGEDAFSQILNPLLKCTKVYKRSVGFFSSSALDFIGEGILAMAQNGGIIHLATCPRLSEQDVNAIKSGYDARNILSNALLNEVPESLNSISDENAKILYLLIKEGILDIKIVLKNGGIYHDKLALLEDFSGNTIACVGSNNESEGGYHDNYEKIRVYKSWTDLEGRIEDETSEFESIWSNTNNELEVFDFTEALKKEVIERVDYKGKYKKTAEEKKPKYDIRDYQDEAKQNWNNNGHKGFFVMATGTGKTVTSLYSIKELVEKEHILTVIAVPYIHLVAQWSEDVKDFFPNAYVQMVHGDIKDAETKIYSNYLASKKNYKPLIVITTMKSFFLEKYSKLYEKIEYKKLLIVDEAHNFINSINDELSLKYPYKLGLSATPVFGHDEIKTEKLLSWFGGKVMDYSIEKAIGKYLVNYEYHPIFVKATENDEKNFNKYTNMMLSAFDKKGNLIDEEKFTIGYRGRLKSISLAEEKMENIKTIFNQIKDKDHTIIYCSDGKILFDDKKKNEQEEIRHLEYILRLINNSLLETNQSNLKASRFTATENMEDRLNLITDFNKGKINYLVAIRCLDEGINIPSIRSALILSSNDNFREFVQRRGRILRLYKNPETNEEKKVAHIYDVIVLPSYEAKSFAEIELRRFYEYSKLACNKERDHLEEKLFALLDEYDMSQEDILFKNDYAYGGELDE